MICYYLKGKNGEYIARDPTGRIKLVSDLGDALLVPEIEKKKIKAIQANNIPDVLKKFGPYEICETDYNGVEAITTDDIVGEIIGSINEFSSKMNEITDYSKELSSIISYTDSQISDILHYIEFHKFSAAEGYKLCKKLQEICDRRREAKNKMQIINTMKTQSCASVLSGNATKRIEKIVPDKKYTPRVFDELFKKNQSRIRKEKSVKIKI